MAKVIQIPTSDDEYAKLDELAKAEGLTIPQYIKNIVFPNNCFKQWFAELIRRVNSREFKKEQEFRIREIMGDEWNCIPLGIKLTMGRIFYKQVNAGNIDRVEANRMDKSKTQCYKKRFNYLFALYPNFPVNFDLANRKDPEYCSKQLIKDLSDLFSDNLYLPNGDIIKIKGIEQTRDQNKRWYAKIQIYDNKDNYLAKLGVTSDYIGASVHWALEAGLSEDEIIKHLSISRTIGGHIIFPTWFSTNTSVSWKEYPDGISLNKARGGEESYYDRFDLTLFAIKCWYEGKPTMLSDIIERNRIWLLRFNDIKGYVDFFKLNDLCDQDYNIYDLTTYEKKDNQYKLLVNDKPTIPTTKNDYMRYIDGVNSFISKRNKRL